MNTAQKKHAQVWKHLECVYYHINLNVLFVVDNIIIIHFHFKTSTHKNLKYQNTLISKKRISMNPKHRLNAGFAFIHFRTPPRWVGEFCWETPLPVTLALEVGQSAANALPTGRNSECTRTTTNTRIKWKAWPADTHSDGADALNPECKQPLKRIFIRGTEQQFEKNTNAKTGLNVDHNVSCSHTKPRLQSKSFLCTCSWDTTPAPR